MLTASAFFLNEFPPLRGLKQFFCIFRALLERWKKSKKIQKKTNAKGARTWRE